MHGVDVNCIGGCRIDPTVYMYTSFTWPSQPLHTELHKHQMSLSLSFSLPALPVSFTTHPTHPSPCLGRDNGRGAWELMEAGFPGLILCYGGPCAWLAWLVWWTVGGQAVIGVKVYPTLALPPCSPLPQKHNKPDQIGNNPRFMRRFSLGWYLVE